MKVIIKNSSLNFNKYPNLVELEDLGGSESGANRFLYRQSEVAAVLMIATSGSNNQYVAHFNVEAGKRYRIQYSAQKNIYSIGYAFTDDNKIIKYCYNSNTDDSWEHGTIDYIAPEGSTKLYVHRLTRMPKVYLVED